MPFGSTGTLATVPGGFAIIVEGEVIGRLGTGGAAAEQDVYIALAALGLRP